jgi:hypothetical protein
MFKIVHNLVDIPSSSYLTPPSRTTRSSHKHKYCHLQTSTDVYKYSFFPHTIKTWNSFPANLAEAPDLETFKRELSRFTLP